MAIIINSITRINAAPCNHFEIAGSVESVPFTKIVNASSLPTDQEVPLRDAILRILRWYNEEKGVTLNGFTNKVILADTLSNAP